MHATAKQKNKNYIPTQNADNLIISESKLYSLNSSYKINIY